MMFFEWDKAFYSVGITKIDDQHEKLVGLVNLLYKKSNEPDRQFVEKILNTLVEYTQTHFRDEEKILKKIHFDQFEEHQLQHKKFIKRIQEFSDKFHKSQNSKEALNEILEFLRAWLSAHILKEDMAYRDYLLS